MTLRWQILIPTRDIPRRRSLLARLMACLQPQLTPEVGIVTMTDDEAREKGVEEKEYDAHRPGVGLVKVMRIPVGAKRQKMLDVATAEWVSCVDDDDLVSSDYVSRCLAAMTADVVGFRLTYKEQCIECGAAVHSYMADVIPKYIRPGVRLRRWKNFTRQPNHLNPVKREFALRAGFRDLVHGEDGDYSRRLAQSQPRPVEVFVDAPLYIYEYVPPHLREGEDALY